VCVVGPGYTSLLMCLSLQSIVVGLVTALTLLLQNRYKQKKAEDVQIKELVAISLAKLQDRVGYYVSYVGKQLIGIRTETSSLYGA